MIVYIIAIGILFISYPLVNKKLYFSINFMIMSLLVGLRGDNIGSDTLRHIEFIRSAGEFDGIDSLLAVNESIRIEIGNILIMQLANSFGDVHLFFIISSFLTFGAIGIFAYKYTPNKDYWSVVFAIYAIGFFMYAMNATRQALAISLACNLYPYIKNNEKIKFSLLVALIAWLFHYSLLIMIPVVWFFSLKTCEINEENIFKIFFVSILKCIFGGIILCIFINAIIEFLPYGGYLLMASEFSRPSEGGWFNLFRGLGVLTMVLATLFISRNNNTSQNDLTNIYWCSVMALMSIFFTILQLSFMNIFYRVIDTFNIYVCVLCVYFFQIAKPRYLLLLYRVVFIVVGVVCLYYMLSSGLNGVDQYNTYF